MFGSSPQHQQQQGSNWCSNCRADIGEGLTWRCQGPCRNYSLCSQCYAQRGPWSGGHNQFHFHTLWVNGRLGTFYCNCCKATIETGSRYHCQTCPDYDECAQCHQQGRIAHPHATSHDATLFMEPGSQPGKYWCDSCRNEIKGLRWHCIHSECKDFDLCASCYNGQLTPASHKAHHDMTLFAEPGSFRVTVGGLAPSTSQPQQPPFTPPAAVPFSQPAVPPASYHYQPPPSFGSSSGSGSGSGGPGAGFPGFQPQPPGMPISMMASNNAGRWDQQRGTQSGTQPPFVCGTTGGHQHQHRPPTNSFSANPNQPTGFA